MGHERTLGWGTSGATSFVVRDMLGGPAETFADERLEERAAEICTALIAAGVSQSSPP